MLFIRRLIRMMMESSWRHFAGIYQKCQEPRISMARDAEAAAIDVLEPKWGWQLACHEKMG
jgi:hypothetical protein